MVPVPSICQHCGSPNTHKLSPFVSYLSYYRCEACGEVWTIRRDDPDKIHRSITTRPDKKPEGSG